MAAVAILADLVHRDRDGGVVGDLHEQDLRRGDLEDADQRAGLARPAVEHPVEGRFDLAQPAQGGRDDGARQPAVAIVEPVERGLRVGEIDQPVERLPLVENGGEETGRGPA